MVITADATGPKDDAATARRRTSVQFIELAVSVLVHATLFACLLQAPLPIALPPPASPVVQAYLMPASPVPVPVASTSTTTDRSGGEDDGRLAAPPAVDIPAVVPNRRVLVDSPLLPTPTADLWERIHPRSIDPAIPTPMEAIADESAPTDDVGAVGPAAADVMASNDGDARAAANPPATLRLAVLEHLARHRIYPRAARRAGIEGDVEVRFVIDASGRLLEVELLRSSGAGVLDASALALLERAAPYPMPADDIVDRVELRVPIEYRLHQAISR